MNPRAKPITTPSGSRIPRPLSARLCNPLGPPIRVGAAAVAPKHAIGETPRVATTVVNTGLGVTAGTLSPGLHSRASAAFCGKGSVVA